MRIRPKHWLFALIIAAFTHSSVLALTLWDSSDSGTANLGTGGVDVAFGTAGGTPGATPAVAPSEVEAIEAQQVPTEPAPQAQQIEEVAPVEVAEAIPQAPIETAPVEVTEAQAVTVKAVVPKKPKPPQAKAVEPTPTPVTTPPVTEVATREPAPVRSMTPPSVAGSAGKSGTQASANTGSGENASSGGQPGSAVSYFALLQAWLEKHKEYPHQARRRRQEGTALLSFTFTRNGRVTNARIVESSGFHSLDREVMAMIRRANPLPPIPDDFPQHRLTLSVPVQFFLR